MKRIFKVVAIVAGALVLILVAVLVWTFLLA